MGDEHTRSESVGERDSLLSMNTDHDYKSLPSEGREEMFSSRQVERDLRRDRVLSLYIVATMALLTTLVVTTFVGVIKNSKPVRLKRRLDAMDEYVERSSKLVNTYDYERYCRENMDPGAWLYFSAAAMTGITYKQNEASFQKIKIRPRHMIDVSGVENNISVNVFGREVSYPVGISPIAFHKWAHPDGELATARAAASSQAVYIVSVHSNFRLEEIRSAAPGAVLWQQMYIFDHKMFTIDLLRRAENAGFQAIVLTIDKATEAISWNRQKGLFTWPKDLYIANFQDISFSKYSPDITWEDVRWFCSQTSLPVILKGVMTTEDAEMAVKVGAKGVMVSNHGGRVLDCLPATIEVLPEIVKAMNGRMDVFVDGGIRTGLDVFKALSKGAKMAFVGRPIIWGLAEDGEAGVANILDILRKEFVNTMKLSGTPSLQNITTQMTFSN